MNKDEFDRLFDEAFDKVTTIEPDSNISDHRPSWKRVKKRIRKEQIFGNVSVTKAFNPLYQTLKELPGEISTLFFGNQDKTDSGAKTKPPAGGKAESQDLNIGQTTKISVTLEEARGKVKFTLPSFGYIPTGYELKKTELFLLPGEELSEKIRFTFKDQSNTFWVTLSQLADNTTVGSGASKAHIEEVQLKYGKGYLTVSDDGGSKLEFLKGNIYIIILGKLEKDDLMRFVEGM
jgi:hypothetical protein